MNSFSLKKPGLFITATDTGVGKTLVTAAMAEAVKRAGLRPGPCKPIGSGSAMVDGHLVSPDIIRIRQYLDPRLDDRVLCPIRYAAPLAPAAAAEMAGLPVDMEAIRQSLETLTHHADLMLIEGIGGLLVPIDRQTTVLDLARAMDYPVVVVTRPSLGTLNHTALTIQALQTAGLRIAGLIVSHGQPDSDDLSLATNADWLEHMNQCPILATLPFIPGLDDDTQALPDAILAPMTRVDWPALAAMPRSADSVQP